MDVKQISWENDRVCEDFFPVRVRILKITFSNKIPPWVFSHVSHEEIPWLVGLYRGLDPY